MRKQLGILLIAISFSSCYSFRGATTTIEKVRVNFIENVADDVNPSLSQDLTEALKRKIESESNVRIVESGYEAEFVGRITAYKVRPVAARAGETAALNRLTVDLEVEFIHTTTETENWVQRFSEFEDYDQNLNLSSVESTLVQAINEKLVDNVFRKAFVNW